MKTKLRLALAMVLPMLLSSCANDAGQGWGELQGTISFGFEDLESRRLPDGAIKTNTAYAVSIDSIDLAVDTLEFTAGPEGGELAEAEPVVAIQLDHAVPLLSGATLTMESSACTNDCVILEKTELTGARIALVRLTASGKVRDLSNAARLDALEAPWRLDVPLDGLLLTAPIEIPVEGERYEINTAVSVHVQPAIFDVIDWQQAVTADAPPPAIAEAIRAALLGSHLEIESAAAAHGEHEAAVTEAEEDDGHGHAH